MWRPAEVLRIRTATGVRWVKQRARMSNSPRVGRVASGREEFHRVRSASTRAGVTGVSSPASAGRCGSAVARSDPILHESHAITAQALRPHRRRNDQRRGGPARRCSWPCCCSQHCESCGAGWPLITAKPSSPRTQRRPRTRPGDPVTSRTKPATSPIRHVS